MASKGVSDSPVRNGEKGDMWRHSRQNTAWVGGMEDIKGFGFFRIPSTPVLLETEFSLNVSNYEMFSPF